MPGNITFATGSAQIRQDFYEVLDSVVDVLKSLKTPAFAFPATPIPWAVIP